MSNTANAELAASLTAKAAVDKASCYHCREPHYALPMPGEQKVI